jgi:hypothetical protein
MPGVYDKFGVKFLYPENWQIVEEEGNDWPKTVTVQSPDGAFLSLYIYEGGVNLRDLVREAVEAMQQEYEDIEVEEILQPTDGSDYGYNLDFYCLDLIITAQIRGALVPGKALVWQCQAENREFDKCELVFRAITTSLLGKLPSIES